MTDPKATVDPSTGSRSAENACGGSVERVKPLQGGLRFEFRRRRAADQRGSSARSPWLDGILAEDRRQREKRQRLAAEAGRVTLDPHRDPSARLLAAWAPVLDELREVVDEPTFTIWILALHPHSLVGGTWRVAAHPGCCRWVQDRFGRLLSECAGRPVEIVACEAVA